MRQLSKCVLALILTCGIVSAEQRIIVRVLGGQLVLNTACLLLGCNVVRGLDDPSNQLFLVAIPNILNLGAVLSHLSGILGIIEIEVDQVGTLLDTRPPVPTELNNPETISYFGSTVRRSYVTQPAVQIIRAREAQQTQGVTGRGIVAIIDTGVDPNHPALKNVLLAGYDFTRNSGNASEMGDVTQSTAAVVDGVPARWVSDSTAAVLDQSTAAVVDDPEHKAFGHGTMVAGVVHLVAPRATILPLKAFGSNGSGYTSDILRAIYRAVRDGSRVINMSFSLSSPSAELKRAIDFATQSGVICVASAGNSGQATTVYPAAWNNVIGVASTTNQDQRSQFSNYGSNLVWVAAPGEGVITSYPYGSYASAWGTSFSTPFVAGTVSLLLDIKSNLTTSQAFNATAQAKQLAPAMGKGRLDTVRAVNAARFF